jgi:hypothetical protein
LVKVPVSKEDLKNAAGRGFINIKIQTVGEGGLAIYGESFGRYPINPSIVIKTK